MDNKEDMKSNSEKLFKRGKVSSHHTRNIRKIMLSTLKVTESWQHDTLNFVATGEHQQLNTKKAKDSERLVCFLIKNVSIRIFPENILDWLCFAWRCVKCSWDNSGFSPLKTSVKSPEKVPLGFEPRISCLLDRYFNQLSHGTFEGSHRVFYEPWNHTKAKQKCLTMAALFFGQG